jgi:histidine ammonia-lyase
MGADRRLSQVSINGQALTVEAVIEVARQKRSVANLDPASEAYERVEESYRWVQGAVENNARLASEGQPARAYYGINTGFGIHAAGRPMADPERTRQASRKLITSHATGIGDYLDEEVVRAAMLIRANTLAKGRSGVRPDVIDLLVEMLNRRITPLIPAIGSLGASGDLAPLAHMALVMIRQPDSLRSRRSTRLSACHGEATISIIDETGMKSVARSCPALRP